MAGEKVATGDNARLDALQDLNVLVVGGGSFGTCLADHLGAMDNNVLIYTRDAAVVDSINNEHRNIKYLSDAILNEKVRATNSLAAEDFKKCSVVLLATPTQFMRQTILKIRDFLEPSHLLILVNKGIEVSTTLLPHQILFEELPEEIARNACLLSGPSFASEVVKRQITCVAVASQSAERTLRTQNLFHAPHFRVYSTDDTVGVEVAGALKNVIAIASGACSGLGLQMNSRAALITRGLAEIARVGVAMGAKPLTFSGLAGVGDLFLTCTSEKSRNYTVGYRVGKGEKLDHVIETLGAVAEGVETTRAAYHLARKLGVDTPQIDAVYSVLYEGVDLNVALQTLILRDPTAELEGLE